MQQIGAPNLPIIGWTLTKKFVPYLTPKEARLRLGLTQQAMANAMGLPSVRTWQKWEYGEREPNSAARQMIAALLYLHARGQLSDFLKTRD